MTTSGLDGVCSGENCDIHLTAAHALSCPFTGLANHKHTAIVHVVVGRALRNSAIKCHTEKSGPVEARHRKDITTKPGLILRKGKIHKLPAT